MVAPAFAVEPGAVRVDADTSEAVSSDSTQEGTAKVETSSGEADAVKSGAAADAQDAKAAATTKAKAFPVGASVNAGYGFNHANFVESNGDYGYQRMSLGMGLSYGIVDGLTASTGLNVQKTLATSYLNPGSASTTTKTPWELADVSVGFAYGNFYTIPVAKIGLSGSLGLGFPTSKASQSAGLIMSVSPSLSARWAMAGFSVSLSGGYSYFLNEDPTVQIDCDLAPQNCIVSGGDTANPNALHNIRGSLGLGYKIIEQLSVSTRYSVANGYRAVKFPDDEVTSEYAQTGTQKGLGRHSFSLGLSYTPIAKTTVGISMASGGSIYTSDNDAIRLPFFDTESQLHHRTSYNISVSQAF